MRVAASRCLALTIAGLLTACTAGEPKPERTSSGTVAPAPDPAVKEIEKAARSAPPPPVAPAAVPAPSTAVQSTSSANQAVFAGAYTIARRPPVPPPTYYPQPTDNEKYAHQDDNPVRLASEQPFSTFAIDVDTGAYANVRRYLNGGQLPPEDAVRVEELINYFDYQYSPPQSRDVPFRVSTELAPAPWNSEALLLRVGIKGFDVSTEQRPAANLVFLVDVSGSMSSPDKLPLLKSSLRLLADQLTARDRVSMVVYAGASGTVLEPTPGDQKAKIRAAIDQLSAGGSTNGGEGIQQAYALAHAAELKGINRVILATDGDFNVGIVNFEALVNLAKQQRKTGVALTTLGFGTGNYNDQLLERLADAGNGNYAYVDSLSEARKVLVSELSSTLFTIAKDVKIQVEFNPVEVLEYRLIGYENRALSREDFSNDKVDAGEIGTGHRVTALYEIIRTGGKGRIDPSRYTADVPRTQAAKSGELALLRLRYKRPDSDDSQLLEFPIKAKAAVSSKESSADFRFAASVSAFGQMLRGGKYLGKFGYENIAALAKEGLGSDDEGYRREFISLVKLAQALTPRPQAEERVGEVPHSP